MSEAPEIEWVAYHVHGKPTPEGWRNDGLLPGPHGRHASLIVKLDPPGEIKVPQE